MHKAELQAFLEDHSPDVVALNETFTKKAGAEQEGGGGVGGGGEIWWPPPPPPQVKVKIIKMFKLMGKQISVEIFPRDPNGAA